MDTEHDVGVLELGWLDAELLLHVLLQVVPLTLQLEVHALQVFVVAEHLVGLGELTVQLVLVLPHELHLHARIEDTAAQCVTLFATEG